MRQIKLAGFVVASVFCLGAISAAGQIRDDTHTAPDPPVHVRVHADTGCCARTPRKSQAGWSPPRVMLQCTRWNMESIGCHRLTTFPGWKWWRRWARPPTGLFYSASIAVLLAIFLRLFKWMALSWRPGASEDHLGAQHLYRKQRNAAKCSRDCYESGSGWVPFRNGFPSCQRRSHPAPAQEQLTKGQGSLLTECSLDSN